MKRLGLAAAALAATMLSGTLSGCVAPVGPVEVTRFHLPDTTALGQGTIIVAPAPGMDGNSLEFRTYAAAVGRQLSLLGYSEMAAGQSDQVALVHAERRTLVPGREDSPVSVGVGGSTGSYGSGVGVGIGLNLSGPPPEKIETRLSVTIRDRASNQSLWEGRASFAVKSSSPLANSQLGAAKMAEALFTGFPGTSGETIQVK
ncbi:MAG: DUF4136 domain-containing protein [Novosphingobium sp.]|nr:DUF4136 domain-containing protein [Novosphingobium sp.]